MKEKKKPKKAPLKIPAKKTKFLTVAEYAKHRGVSEKRVRDAIETARIEPVDPEARPLQIDPVQADEDWEAFGDTARMPADLDDDEGPGGEDEGDEDLTDGSLAGRAMKIAKAKRERWLAKQARLDFLEQSGKLIPVDKVKKEAFAIARITRDAILNIPDRIAAELCGINDQAAMHNRLTKELNLALRDLVNKHLSKNGNGEGTQNSIS